MPKLEESKPFRTVREFNKIYDEMRLRILERHGYKKGDKVKLVRATQLMISIDGGNYMPFTMIKSDMVSELKTRENLGDTRATFKLCALV